MILIGGNLKNCEKSCPTATLSTKPVAVPLCPPDVSQYLSVHQNCVTLSTTPVPVPRCPPNAVYSDNHVTLMNTMCRQIIPAEKPRRRGENKSKVDVNSMRGRALDSTRSRGFSNTAKYVRVPQN